MIIAKTTEEVLDYKSLNEAACLPLPGFGKYIDEHNIEFGDLKLHNCGSEWKRAMWNMAGQKVRSHLGWVRRRSREQLLWHLEKKLFEQGGWIRNKRNGKEIKSKERQPDDIVFSLPKTDKDDYQRREGYSTRRWFNDLQGEYEGVEMPRLFAGLTFAARSLPRIGERMVKGWPKIREKWRKVVTKKPNATTAELVEQVNVLRRRKPRDFGDQALFEWLARPVYQYLWDGRVEGNDNECGRDDRDCVAVFAAYNERFAELPSSITFTENHALRHPVWAFFGENSAVKYKLRCEAATGTDGRTRKTLWVVFDQLLSRKADDGGFTAINEVRVPLKGYRDFENSFRLPPDGDIASTTKLTFSDVLLDGELLPAKLGGIKLIWNRADFPKDAKNVPGVPPTKRSVRFV